MEQNILGKNIAALRKAKGMTQETLANQLGITFQAVSKWETGLSCPDVIILPELADLLGVSIDELFGRAPLVHAEEVLETQQTQQVVYHELPWEDDRTQLHVVLFAGHKLIGNSIFQRYQREKQQVEFCWEGPALNIQSDFSVTCGEETVIQGNVTAGDSVTCGQICGNATAGDHIHCGAVGGSVNASDSVDCEVVAGSVRAGDGVRCGDVGGNVQAGDSVTCGDVGGDVHAGDSVRCTAVYGNAVAPDGVHIQHAAKAAAESVRETAADMRAAAADIARQAADIAREATERAKSAAADSVWEDPEAPDAPKAPKPPKAPKAPKVYDQDGGFSLDIGGNGIYFNGKRVTFGKGRAKDTKQDGGQTDD